MKERAGCIIYILYFLMGLVQLVAIVKGIEIWFGIGTFFSVIIAFFITYIPIVGTLAGIFGAVKGFGWSYFAAIILFCWPYIIYLTVFFFVGIEGVFNRGDS